MTRLIAFNKPFGVLSQFTDAEGRATLKEYIPVPGVYVCGRLDRDSEGLLLLTDDGALQHRISDPRHKLPKTYWIQVEGTPDRAVLRALTTGVALKDGSARAIEAALIDEPPGLWPRDPPIRSRLRVPTAWLSITVAEGRNRMVRRMSAAVGLPTLRLIRARIGRWALNDLAPGVWRENDPTILPRAPKERLPKGQSGHRKTKRP